MKEGQRGAVPWTYMYDGHQHCIQNRLIIKLMLTVCMIFIVVHTNPTDYPSSEPQENQKNSTPSVLCLAHEFARN